MPLHERWRAGAIASVIFMSKDAVAQANDVVVARVRVEGAPCVDDEAFRERLAASGRTVVAPASDEDASSIDVVVERCAPFGQDVYVGRLCVRVFDVGNVSEPATYEIQVNHP